MKKKTTRSTEWLVGFFIVVMLKRGVHHRAVFIFLKVWSFKNIKKTT